MSDDKHEIMRELLELALNYGKKHRSSQTGYLHFYHGAQNSEPHLPIPVFENFLLALALLRSRTIENVNESKVLIEGLLHFQNKKDEDIAKGNFPIYLHEYPNCKDRFNSVNVGIVIYWILKLFHQVLGQDLNLNLEKTLLLIIDHALRTHEEKSAPYPIALKIAALAKAGGHLLNLREHEEKGRKLLHQMEKEGGSSSWFCPQAMGSILVALKMVYPRLSASPWNHFWKHLSETWHNPTGTYVGPALKVFQQVSEPQVTLYDLFLGHYSGFLTDRMKKDSPVHLEAVLITPCEDIFEQPVLPFKFGGSIEGAKWTLYQSAAFAYSLIEQGKLPLNPSQEVGFHPFRLVWGDKKIVHTFVCQGGNSKEVSYSFLSPQQFEIIFDVDGPVEVEDREQCRDAIFFVDAHETLNFLISGKKSSTFRLDEPIIVQSENMQLTLKFTLEEGEGRFIGHRMLSNRPSQLNTKGIYRYDAYDWTVFLRTLGRTEKCRLRANIQIAHE